MKKITLFLTMLCFVFSLATAGLAAEKQSNKGLKAKPRSTKCAKGTNGKETSDKAVRKINKKNR
ncbi:hypothetical protein SAMN02745165_01993 [Malonomonas rubra DSM 5091]|uniref:Pentapeptide MXKDX repeat protein n=1 Tax=Malonomonas rubra DSM 5091 TaxID=1122189 RepID=A0A1M6I369_MALRU|nr:hypothetical protein [Malonomonas rubra]SHJ28917.1 hypothetical protein SAMN02745165_01993 [Malonomonas rubra DSM 5091]